MNTIKATGSVILFIIAATFSITATFIVGVVFALQDIDLNESVLRGLFYITIGAMIGYFEFRYFHS
jgi:hypothetical protein